MYGSLYYQSGTGLMQKLSPACSLARAMEIKLRGQSQGNFCLPELRAMCQHGLKQFRFYFGKITEDVTNITKHRIKNRCHFTQLQSNPFKQITLGPDYEHLLRHSIHLSVFYTLQICLNRTRQMISV